MSDEVDNDPSEWIHYHEFAEERVHKYSDMLEQFEIGGPGPPFDFPEPPDFFPPPPPIPGNVEECETFSSHFDNCDISKESTSSQDPYLHLMSVIVAVFCLIILASCITIFLVWRRRRSKSHRSSLHSYCVSGAGRGGQLYDDLYLSGHLPRLSNNYTTTNTFYNRNQVDLASFLLQTSPEGQPIYEEIPPGQSDNSSDYMETSGYNSLPIDNEYAESERGLFLVPVNGQHKPLIISGDFQVPGGKTNKKFFTFHRKTLENNKTLQVHDHDIVNSNFLNQFDPLDNCRPQQQHQPKKTKCGKSLVHSKTLNLQPSSHQRQVMVRSRWAARPGGRTTTYQAGTVSARQPRPVVDNSVSRHNQDNFLPRTAWTDTSGSDDWLDLANDNPAPHTATTTASSSKNSSDYYSRPGCPSPPDLISNKCRVPPPPTSPSVISTSDVTVSPSSSESYPECRF